MVLEKMPENFWIVPCPDSLYRLMRPNAVRTATYFNIPPEQAIEIGTEIKF
jgi:K+ transporter